ncbi:MAG: hypothetical protein U5K56_20730 [Halioglobus sp.]|nr:hypothetical protein [Halioglobus sp.]
MSLVKEFREFAVKANMVDMAVREVRGALTTHRAEFAGIGP